MNIYGTDITAMKQSKIPRCQSQSHYAGLQQVSIALCVWQEGDL